MNIDLQIHRCKWVVVPDAALAVTTSSSQYAVNCFKCWETCSESSRVGTKINARVLWTESALWKFFSYVSANSNQSSLPTADFAFKIFWTSGIQYAAVLPDPVRARARISRFSNARGIDFDWINVGLENPMSPSALRILESNKWENEANFALPSTKDSSGISPAVLCLLLRPVQAVKRGGR